MKYVISVCGSAKIGSTTGDHMGAYADEILRNSKGKGKTLRYQNRERSRGRITVSQKKYYIREQVIKI